MRHLGMLAALLLGAAVPAEAQQADTPEETAERAAADRALERWTTDRLTGFASEAEFAAYLRDLRASARAHDLGWARGATIRFASLQQDTQQPICPADDPDCLGQPTRENLETVTVTGSMNRPQPITNNQEVGVDEGDIVKQVGRFLLVLQDGRIFSIDTQGGRGRRLVLVDRANVYRSGDDDAWYDEMVVHDNRVIITGYSYRREMSEIAVFRLGEDGRLSHQGTFQIESQDYYSANNYSTRIVGDRLILYTPIALSDLDPDEPIRWPKLRRWAAGDQGSATGRQLLDARAVHRPTLTTRTPTLHSISVCPLGPVGRGRDLDCRTTAFIAGPGRVLYVSPSSAFLWTSQSRFDDSEYSDYEETRACAPGHRPSPDQVLPATIYRVPVREGQPAVLGARGAPFDQLGLDSSNGQFRALLGQYSEICRPEKSHPISYFSIDESRFSRRRVEAPLAAYTAMPDVPLVMVENRFTDDFLVFGGRHDWYSAPTDREGGIIPPSPAVVVPLAAPQRFTVLQLPHNVIRVERIGDNAVLTGYANEDGLSLSVVRTGGAPKVTSTVLIPGRYEGEGRSHAFNSLIDDDNSGIMGLPTVLRPGDANRWWWRSGPSDVSFLTVDADGILLPAGSLRSSREAGDERPDFTDAGDSPNGYVCEVSCVDWYGNTRPIFTDGRIFALTGTELVEGREGPSYREEHDRGAVEEVQRLDLTAPVWSGSSEPIGSRR